MSGVPPQRVAVVGAGLAGLAAAWWLGQRHEVTLLERLPRPGFTAASLTLAGGVRVDVPLRVFYRGYYPTLARLHAELGVESEPVSYAAAFSGADGRPYFRYRNLRLGGWSWGVLAPQDWWLSPQVPAIVGALLRARRDLRGAAGTLGDAAARAGWPRAFVEGFLLPAVATVCTCSHEQARALPAAVAAGYVERGLVREAVRRARHGADDVERRLLAGIARVHTGVEVDALRREGDAVALRIAGAEQRFDHVVLATPANVSLRLLADATAAERRLLGAFRYAAVEVVTHRDTALLPPRRAHWAPVNLRVVPEHPAPESTIWLNAVQPALRRSPPLFQTVHPQREPDAATVVGRARFERPLVDAASQRALDRLPALHAEPGRRIWFCGSWAQPGVPLLESAVRSAAEVAALLGAAPGAESPP